MKKIVSFVTLLSVIFSFVGCGMQEKCKNDVFSLVKENYNTISTACKGKDSETLLSIDGITQVNIVDGYVLVYCKGAGIAPSSQDYGFYYTEENIPVGVSCNLGIVCYSDTMQSKGSGYEGTVDYNTFYTEHIMGNIYFYSNAY